MNPHRKSVRTAFRPNLVSGIVRLGTLALAAIFTATQMPAQDAAAAAPQSAAQQTAGAPTGASQPAVPETSTASTAQAASSRRLAPGTDSLPESPAAAAPNSESASVTMPPEMRAMMLDAAQQSQSLQPAKAKQGVQQPGMLVLGIAGLPLLALGSWIYVAKGSAAARAGFGSMFFVPGALMSGFGFHYAFKPKNN